MGGPVRKFEARYMVDLSLWSFHLLEVKQYEIFLPVPEGLIWGSLLQRK